MTLLFDSFRGFLPLGLYLKTGLSGLPPFHLKYHICSYNLPSPHPQIFGEGNTGVFFNPSLCLASFIRVTSSKWLGGLTWSWEGGRVPWQGQGGVYRSWGTHCSDHTSRVPAGDCWGGLWVVNSTARSGEPTEYSINPMSPLVSIIA